MKQVTIGLHTQGNLPMQRIWMESLDANLMSPILAVTNKSTAEEVAAAQFLVYVDPNPADEFDYNIDVVKSTLQEIVPLRTIEQTKVIVVEGPDYVGKTTFINWLDGQLKAKGFTTELLHEPGSTPVGELMRSTCKTNPDLTPVQQSFMMNTSRVGTVGLMETAVQTKANHIILLDRYTATTMVYQYYVQRDYPGNDRYMHQQICSYAVGNFVTDYSMILTAPKEDILARAKARKVEEGVDADVLDQLCLDNIDEVLAGYDTVTKEELFTRYLTKYVNSDTEGSQDDRYQKYLDDINSALELW